MMRWIVRSLAGPCAAWMAVAWLCGGFAKAGAPEEGVTKSGSNHGQRDGKVARLDLRVEPVWYPAPPGEERPAEAGQAVAEVASTSGRITMAEAIRRSEPGEHPLMPALRWAMQGVESIRRIEDYSCTLVKRERIDGELRDHEWMYVKIRHRPFSIYTRFLKPKDVEGREAIYVEGRNDNKIQAHTTGRLWKLIGTVSLAPTSPIAMKGNRYPITEMGMLNLTERLIEVGLQDCQYGECEVKVIENAKINKRPCTCIQVVHPVPRRNFLFHMARIYVDNELNLPTRYEAYDWPEEEGGEPVLTEEYTYLNIKINQGFTDQDFDPKNPEYSYP